MSSIENDIQTLLSEGIALHTVAINLFQRLEQERLTPAQKRSILNFAYNSGMHSLFLNYAANRIKMEKSIPWAMYTQILHENGIKYQQSLCSHIFEGAQKNEGLKDLLDFTQWDHLDPRFHPLRTSRDKERQVEFKKVKEHMREKILYLQQQRMLDEEQLALQKYKEMYPNDPFVEQQMVAYKERWAREIIASRASSIRESRIERSAQSSDPYSIKWAEFLNGELKSIISRYPNQAYNLAVGFLMMDLPNLSIIALQLAPKEENCEWLQAEALILAGRPLDSIGVLYEIEARYASKPETSFGVGYLRAQALWKLGQREMALNILQSIVKIRPNYRSAATFIEEWTR